MGRAMLQENPAERTLGIKVPSHMKGREKRKPFSPAELQTIFGSPIYTQQLRSRGQSGEATYWIPVLMLYTGARPEELAGLRVEDVMHESTVGWYLNVTDLPGPEDTDLFEPPQKGATGSAEHAGEERRHLKNVASRRQIPLASELERLGLLRYVEWVKQQGSSSLFPTLTPDTHGKLSGAHSKFFGRLKRRLGINSPYKTLYSLRHNMKDFLEAANVPTRYLKRLLGHTTGDGTVTDGYGSGLPLEQLADHFSKVTFPGIPAQPWMPGKGYLSIR
jgi:integrase